MQTSEATILNLSTGPFSLSYPLWVPEVSQDIRWSKISPQNCYASGCDSKWKWDLLCGKQTVQTCHNTFPSSEERYSAHAQRHSEPEDKIWQTEVYLQSCLGQFCHWVTPHLTKDHFCPTTLNFINLYALAFLRGLWKVKLFQKTCQASLTRVGEESRIVQHFVNQDCHVKIAAPLKDGFSCVQFTAKISIWLTGFQFLIAKSVPSNEKRCMLTPVPKWCPHSLSGKAPLIWEDSTFPPPPPPQTQPRERFLKIVSLQISTAEHKEKLHLKIL